MTTENCAAQMVANGAAPTPPWYADTFAQLEKRSAPQTPSHFGRDLSQCLTTSTQHALEIFRHTNGDQVFFRSNAGYLYGILPEFAQLSNRVFFNPEETHFLRAETYSDEMPTIQSTFNQETRRIENAEMKLHSRTHSAIVDPTNKTDNLPIRESFERPQVKISLTEVDYRDAKKIQASLTQLEIAAGYTDGSTNPSALLGLNTYAKDCAKTLNRIWTSRLSVAYNVSYFDTTQCKVDTMTLGNFNILIYPDKNITLELWLNTEDGSRRMLVIPSEYHGIEYEEIQSYLTKLHHTLASSAKIRERKHK